MTSSFPGSLTHATARVGLLAKGLMYLLLGVTVARLAGAGPSGRPADGEGVLRTLVAQPAGRALLGLLAVGFAAYALWQLRCAWTNDDVKTRLVAALRFLVWSALGFSAGRIVLKAGGSGNAEQSLTARLLSLPFGAWLVAAIGAGIIVAAVVMLRRLRHDGYLEDLRPLPPPTRRIVSVAATVGIIARSLVYALAGAFLVRAGLTHDPRGGVGLDAALSQVARESYGRYALLCAAIGLGAYAAWCVVRARYEDVEHSEG